MPQVIPQDDLFCFEFQITSRTKPGYRSPCSLNIIPKHLGHRPISSFTNFLNLVQT